MKPSILVNINCGYGSPDEKEVRLCLNHNTLQFRGRQRIAVFDVKNPILARTLWGYGWEIAEDVLDVVAGDWLWVLPQNVKVLESELVAAEEGLQQTVLLNGARLECITHRIKK